MRKWQGYYQPGGHEVQQLDRLIVEAQGGAPARLPEAVHFAAANGDPNAANALQADAMRREQLLGELMGGLDPAEFERFRAKQRAAAQAALGEQMLRRPGVVGGVLDARRELLNALTPRGAR